MHIRWRGLELPSRVVRDEAISDERYGRFEIEPFEQGFGTTIGNSLRRVLLSSLEGAAITTVKLAGVSHEFTSIDGVMEDVTDILLNLKGVVLTLDGDTPKVMTLRCSEAGEVKAGAFEADPAITLVDPEHVLATLTDDVSFEMEVSVRRGRGYATAAENRGGEQELGVIPIDSIFSPVQRVRFRTEDMRVGQRTNYDRLIMEIWTNGAVSPEDALAAAGMILRKHVNALVMCQELGDDVVTVAAPQPEAVRHEDTARVELLSKPVATLNLSVRASNCLEAARVTTIGALAELSVADLLRVRSFGKTSLQEVQRKLAEHGLSLGMGGVADDGEDIPMGMSEDDVDGAGMESFSSDDLDTGSVDSLTPESILGSGPLVEVEGGAEADEAFDEDDAPGAGEDPGSTEITGGEPGDAGLVDGASPESGPFAEAVQAPEPNGAEEEL